MLCGGVLVSAVVEVWRKSSAAVLLFLAKTRRGHRNDILPTPKVKVPENNERYSC